MTFRSLGSVLLPSLVLSFAWAPAAFASEPSEADPSAIDKPHAAGRDEANGVAPASDRAALDAGAEQTAPAATNTGSASAGPTSAGPTSAGAPISVSRGALTCVADNAADYPAPDVRTILLVACRELAAQEAPAGRYQVGLSRLGHRTYVSLESGDQRREAWAVSLEEVPLVLARLSAAVVHNQSLEKTETTDNITAEDARRPKVKEGRTGVDLGLFGFYDVLDSDAVTSGISVQLVAERKQLALVAGLRLGGLGGDGLAVGSLEVGGRYFMSDRPFAPYVGAGLMTVSYGSPDSGNSGFGGYGEAGLAVLRTSSTGFNLGVRADAPFFSLERDSWSDDGESEDASQYALPLSLTASITFR